MKMKIRVLIGIWTLAVLCMTSCDMAVMTGDEGGSSEHIPATIEITTEEAQPEEQLKMHLISDGIYEMEMECNFGFITNQLVKDSCYVVAGEVDGVQGLTIIDLRTGNIEKQYSYGEGYLSEVRDSIIFVGYDGGNYLFRTLQEEPEEISEEEVMNLENSIEDPFDISSYGICPLSVNEQLLSGNEFYCATCCWVEEDVYVAVYKNNGELLYYDKSFYEEDICPADASIDREDVYLTYYDYETYEHHLFYMDMSGRSAMERPYLGKYDKGITILTGEDVLIEANECFQITPVTDETEIMYARQAVQSAINQFPEGFFDEMLSGEKCPRQSFVICLTGSIIQEGQDVSNPGGLAFYDVDTYYVLLDVSGAWEGVDYSNNVAHECMHTIDSYLEYIGEDYPDWNMYIPSEDSYLGNYSGEDGSMGSYENTCFGEDAPENVWFVEPYSKTNCLEDRATTFAAMFSGYEYCRDYPHIVDKMDYLAQILRKNFKSVQNCERVVWEY